MCGIITIASPPFHGFSGTLPAVPASAAGLSTPVLDQIDFEAFYSVYCDRNRYDAWRSLASHLAGNSGTVGSEEGNGTRSRNRRELDLRWRIERDLLSLVDAVSELLVDPNRELPPQGVRMGWLVELALRALSRLEVRGRDSAGLTLLAWPRDGQERIIPDAANRTPQAGLPHTLARLSCDPGGGLALTYKVAEEVGALGYNDSVLRKLIAGDKVFREIAAADPGCLLVVGHTRWASTGEISTANAHPVDGSIAVKAAGSQTAALVPVDRTLAVVNGDVDNYQAIARDLFDDSAFELPRGVTTDSKIVPVLVELSACTDMEEKLREATGRIQGSLTCVLVRMDSPGRFWSFTKGSGQSLYAGVAGDTCILASEVYGCLELVRNYFPFAGESAGRPGKSMVCRVQFAAPPLQFTDVSTVPAVSIEPRYKVAEITTRDVDRRGYRHYFRKELEEAIDSVTQTIVGRYSRTPSSSERAEAQFSTLYTGSDIGDFVQKIASSAIRHFVFIGQGSAHIAGLAGAHFINEHCSAAGLRADAVTAGEFSAHWLRGDLSGTCIVAVSQSGTTTDTNRAAKLARARGATVLGILNRRDSTLAEISNLVIYTSDGRDVEMAVASTKAFYSQVVACFLLAQHCGLTTGALVPAQVCAALAEVERLPDVMRDCFRQEERIGELARSTAIRRRHWSVLGSGTSRIAAQEIRIKMSELCYKTASVDYLEDKKHIDLSAEPLIVVPVFDLRDDLVEDVAKEVAIFSAHNAAPVVFCDRGIERYRELTPNVIQVPAIGFSLGIVSSALVGHLFAYHTAMAIEEIAERLRGLRRCLVRAYADSTVPVGESPLKFDGSEVRDLSLELATGRLDAVLSAAVASRLSIALAWLAGYYRAESLTALPANALGLAADSALTPMQWVMSVIDATIGDTTRPIDSVRHQAKTVTVGTTRSGYSEASATAQALRTMGIALDDVPIRVQHLLGLLDAVLATVPGGVRYQIEDTAEPVTAGERLNLRVTRKIGCSADRASRYDAGTPVSGTKAIAVHRRQPMLIRGVRDNVPIFVFPLLQNGRPVELVLLHLQFEGQMRADIHEGLLAAFPQRKEVLQTILEEAKGRPVTAAEISRLPLEILLFGAPDDAIRSCVD